MRIAPLADLKARLSAYLDECGVEGAVVITRNGRAVAVLLAPYDDDDLERLLLGRSPRFRALLNRSPGKHQGREGFIREGFLGCSSKARTRTKGRGVKPPNRQVSRALRGWLGKRGGARRRQEGSYE